MFQKCNIYYYMGLYLSEEEFQKLGFFRLKGSDIISELGSYDHVYTFDNYEQHEVFKEDMLKMVSTKNNQNKDFCYQVRNGGFVLFPIEIFYGISANGNLLTYYTDKAVCDAKLQVINRDGNLNAIVDDMNEGRIQVTSFNVQQQLCKVRSALEYKN